MMKRRRKKIYRSGGKQQGSREIKERGKRMDECGGRGGKGCVEVMGVTGEGVKGMADSWVG